MKKSLITFIVFIASTALFAQQLPLHNQYMLNDFLINPAVAGKKAGLTATLSHRSQWTGIEGAPITQVLSAHGLFGNNKSALGGMVFNDMTSVLGRTGFRGAYAYHIKLKNDFKLSLGLAFGAIHYRIDVDKVTLDQEDDDAIYLNTRNKLVPDADFGAYLYADNIFVGISVNQLFESKIKFTDNTADDISHLSRHIFVTAGTKFVLDDNIKIEPGILFKGVKGAPFQFDINTTVSYKDKFYIGVSYRTRKDLVVFAQVIIKDALLIGYSYDFAVTPVQTINTGAHEIVLSYFLPNKVREEEESMF